MLTEENYPSPKQEVLKQIKENVDIVKSEMSDRLDVNLDLNGASIEWIDGFIDRNRESFNGKAKETLVSTLGSFLGEAIIKNFGGRWALNRGNLGIYWVGKLFVLPFVKVLKQMNNGPEDSIYIFYRYVRYKSSEML